MFIVADLVSLKRRNISKTLKRRNGYFHFFTLNSLHAREFVMVLLLSANYFSKLIFIKKSLLNTVKMSNCLYPDQYQHSVVPDLATNCLQM